MASRRRSPLLAIMQLIAVDDAALILFDLGFNMFLICLLTKNVLNQLSIFQHDINIST